jgi:hypothetical protein
MQAGTSLDNDPGLCLKIQRQSEVTTRHPKVRFNFKNLSTQPYISPHTQMTKMGFNTTPGAPELS